jgi:two-component system nitrogen regulation sensor histidine kinase NtrY
VAQGDLSVRVAPTGRDELDELGRAFDRMVGELGDARSRLEYLQKVSAWQEVARRLAHEIKNPLTPIQLAVQELRSQYRGGDAGYQQLLDTAGDVLDEEIGAIRRLVDDFSAFAKLPKVEPSPVDLGR